MTGAIFVGGDRHGEYVESELNEIRMHSIKQPLLSESNYKNNLLYVDCIIETYVKKSYVTGLGTVSVYVLSELLDDQHDKRNRRLIYNGIVKLLRNKNSL